MFPKVIEGYAYVGAFDLARIVPKVSAEEKNLEISKAGTGIAIAKTMPSFTAEKIYSDLAHFLQGKSHAKKHKHRQQKKVIFTLHSWVKIGENGHKSGQSCADTKAPEGKPMKVTRTKVFGRSIIIRRRKATKRALNYTQGEVFNSVHGGLWSLYWEHGKGRNIDISIDDR